MALIHVDWNPEPRKVRQFGALLALFLLLIAWRVWRKGHADAAAATAVGAVLLGSAVAAAPSFGRKVYQAWMAVAFVIGSFVSAVMLIMLYYAVVTPLGLLFRRMGRDALALRPGGKESYWAPLDIPEDKTYYERLF